jgi:serine phosphatase RsbU (regulator of sigma subunit)
MIYSRFRFVVVLRTLLIAITVGLSIFLFVKLDMVLLALLLFALLVYQIYSLIRFNEKTNRDLNRFLDSIRFSDFSQTFSSANLGPTFQDLKASFERVTQEFLKVRAEKEERFQYFQTVVEHVGTGLISFRADGEIEFMNKAASQILDIEAARSIHSFEKISPEFVQTLLNLKSGEHTVFKLKIDGQQTHIAVHATQFKQKQLKYTLITLQNIQNEIERERISRELEIGQEVQKKLMPNLDFRIAGVDIAGFCLPAREVGGDYYDVMQLNENQLSFLIGDVSGKGLPAAIYMTLTKGIIQASMDSHLSPAQALIKANRLIYQTMERGFFVSLILAFYDIVKKELVFSRAGHNPVIHFRSKDQTLHFLRPDGIALGLENGQVFDQKIQETKLHLGQGDYIVLYTDGFSEAMNEQDQEFSEERMAELIKSNHDLKAKEMITKIFNDLNTYTGDAPRHDDMTMVILKIE